MDDTNNKSSGTSSDAWKHRLRTKGWDYHVSPEGFYMDVDGSATHMYRTYGSRTTHMYRKYGIRVTQDAVTEERLSRSSCRGEYQG